MLNIKLQGKSDTGTEVYIIDWSKGNWRTYT